MEASRKIETSPSPMRRRTWRSKAERRELPSSVEQFHIGITVSVAHFDSDFIGAALGNEVADGNVVAHCIASDEATALAAVDIHVDIIGIVVSDGDELHAATVAGGDGEGVCLSVIEEGSGFTVSRMR